MSNFLLIFTTNFISSKTKLKQNQIKILKAVQKSKKTQNPNLGGGCGGTDFILEIVPRSKNHKIPLFLVRVGVDRLKS